MINQLRAAWNADRLGAYIWVSLVFLAIAVTITAIFYLAARPPG